MKTPEFFAIALAVAVLGVADGTLAEQAKKLFFEGDLVRHTLENQKGPFCVLTSQFKRKEAVAWRIRVLDSAGDVADDKAGTMAHSFRHSSSPRATTPIQSSSPAQR